MNTEAEHNGVKVSVLVPSYNSVSTLPAALESALDQTFDDFEILLIDDGSTDSTREVVAGFVQNHPGKIRYIYQENMGLAAARNTGIRAARGELIALLDADDQWLPWRLERGVACLQRHSQAGLVHANIHWMDEQGHIMDAPIRDLSFLKGNMFKNIFLRKAHVACPTALFRKVCCDKVGMFDEELTRLGCEDRELWLRIAKEFDVIYLNEILSNYRVSSSSMSRNQEKMYQARMYVVDKHCLPGRSGALLRNRAVARILSDRGDEEQMAGRFESARSFYLDAARLFPFSVSLWVNYLKTFIKKR